MRRSFIAMSLVGLAMIPTFAVAESGQVDLNTAGAFQRKVVNYDCGTAGPLQMTYVNADPNYLAILPINGLLEPLVFSAILSGSGTRYAAAKWQWWSTGKTGSLHDATLGDDAPAVLTCTQIIPNS